jgi:putative tricarboxylic transport membrane protein
LALWAIVVLGVGDFVLRRHGWAVAPILPCLIPRPMLETHLRRTPILSRGDYGVFGERPIAAVRLTAADVHLLLPLPASAWCRRRLAAPAER